MARPSGRPSRLTDQTRRILLGTIRGGQTYRTACQLAGIHPATFSAWMARGAREQTGMYHEFHDAVKDAEARLEGQLVSRIHHAGKRQWTANAWLLERRFTQAWGRRDTVILERQLSEEVRRLARAQGLSDEEAAQAVATAELLLHQAQAPT